MKIGDHQENMSLKSKAVKRWLTKELWNTRKKPINSDVLDSVIRVLESKACFDGQQYILQNRLALHNGELWYDLTNEKWQAIKVNKEGWKTENNVPILFNRYPHNQAQVIPQTNGDIRSILKYINISDHEQQLLFLVYLVSCFIPDFPHPIIIIFGPQGSAKSTLSKLLRQIIDPSFVEVASLPSNNNELIQALAHHTFLCFDNVSFISEEISDTLCKAITGSGFIKRELYTNDEDIIYRLKRCVGINGINLVATRPDLLDRSLLIELERIDDSDRKQEKNLNADFEKDLPLILGNIFDVISSTLKTIPSIKLTTFPRMADFALIGCAIAESLGYTKEEFLNAYQNNISKQTETILNENIIAGVLISFMESRDWEKWEGTASKLLEELNWCAPKMHVETREKHWPKAPQALSRALNRLKVTLQSADISVAISAGQKRKITIEKITPVVNDPVTPLITGNLLVEHDNDDIDGNF